MQEFLQFLQTGSDVGVYLILLFAFKFHDRIKDLAALIAQHIALDEAEHKRTNRRLEILEDD